MGAVDYGLTAPREKPALHAVESEYSDGECRRATGSQNLSIRTEVFNGKTTSIPDNDAASMPMKESRAT